MINFAVMSFVYGSNIFKQFSFMNLRFPFSIPFLSTQQMYLKLVIKVLWIASSLE